jgi:putative SOS response-associated peptidase YedK
MCGRVVQASPPDQLGLRVVSALDPRDSRVEADRYGNVPLWVIRRNPDTGQASMDLLKWGLVPYWCKERPKPPPINAKAETVSKLPMFRDAYRRRRCIVPVVRMAG